MDIYQEILTEKVFPVVEAIFAVLERKFPLSYRLLRRFFSKKVLALKEKYSNQGSRTFSAYKGYFIMLFQKKSAL